MKLVTMYIALLASLIICSGCATEYTLQMKASIDPQDTSSLSPKLKTKKYSRIMIMPPSGTKRGEFDSVIALCEKVFLKQGITPINGAITGRVVMQIPGDAGKEKNENAQNLSDVERAFIMAKESNCDAILQIGKFEAGPPSPTRFFVAERRTRNPVFREVAEEFYQSWLERKYAFLSTIIVFEGRLTDVQTGEVLASIHVLSSPNWNLPADYEARLHNGMYIKKQNYAYDSRYFNGAVWVPVDGPWVQKAKDRAVEAILNKVAANITGE